MLRIALASVVAAALPLLPLVPGTAAAARLTAGAPAPADSAGQLAEVYAVATARLLESAPGEAVVLLPTPANITADVAVRARRASGPAQHASAATARRVAALLAGRGMRGVRGAATAGAPGEAVQLVLGELRYEPGQAPRFARLKIVVVGADGARAAMNFLMKKDATGWTTLNMESAASIG
jgi:hypothetical protein